MSATLASTSLDRDQLLGVARAERARLGRMVQFAEPETWEQPSAAAGWWNRDVMAHLGALDTAAAQLLAGGAAEEMHAYLAEHPGEPLMSDGFNARSVDHRSGLDTRAVLDTWGRAADAMIAYAAELSDDAWRDARYRWFSGDIAPRFLVQSAIMEWFLHGEDMRATNGVRDGWQSQWQHWPVYLTVDLAVRMLPWRLQDSGRDLAGASVLIDLEGAGEGTWHWALEPGEVASPGREPDAVILGRAPQLALVVGRRLDPDQALDAGTVVLGGDVELAELVLRTAQPYV